MATKLRVGGVPEHFNAPWYIAKQKGAFAAAGIELEYTDYPGGTGAMTKALNENALDVAILLTEGCVKDIATGGAHKIVAVYVQSSLCWGIHTGSAQEDIQSVSDLDGKGWDYTQLKYELVGDLKGAQEKYTTKPLVDAGLFRRVGQIPTPWPCFVITVRTEALEQHGPLIKQLLTVIQGACKDFKANPTTPSYVAQNYGQKEEDAAEWFETVEWNYDGAPVDPAMLQMVGDTLVELKVINKTPPVDALLASL